MDSLAEPVSTTTKFIRVLGRSRWNEVDASLAFDWPGTQILLRVLGSPTEVMMTASIGEDALSVYVDGCLHLEIGPQQGGKATYLLVRDAPEDCVITIVKRSEPNMDIPVIIYDLFTRPCAQQDGGIPCVAPFDFRGGHPGLESTVEFVGDSDTSGLFNMVVNPPGGGCTRSITALESNIEEGWPFHFARRFDIACPVVVALSGAGVHAGPHREKSLSEYYPRVLCCRENPNNIAPFNDPFSDEAGPLCIIVFVGGNDLLPIPESPFAQRACLEAFVSGHQALLRRIRHYRPCSPIVSLYAEAESCSGCQSSYEREWLSSNLETAVVRSVATLGGAHCGFFSCKVHSDIRQQCPADWAHDLHWGANAHSKFADGAYEALRALIMSEGDRESGQCFPGMARLAAKLRQTAPGQASPRWITPIPCWRASSAHQPHQGEEHQQCHGHLGEIVEMNAGTEGMEQHVPAEEMEISGMVNGICAAAEDDQRGSLDSFNVAGEDVMVLHDSIWLGETGVELRLHNPSPSMEQNGSASRCADFFVAAHAGNADVVQALLESRAFAPSVKVFAEQLHGSPFSEACSALHLAAGAGHSSVTACLLHSEIFSDDLVNSKTDEASHTALHLACMEGNEEVVKMLLNSDRFTGVNSTARTAHPVLGRISCTALTYALGHGHESVACVLLRHQRFDVADATPTNHANALQSMSKDGWAQGVRAYLEWHERKRSGAALPTLRFSTLWEAAEAGDGSIIEILASHPRVDAGRQLEHQRDCSGRSLKALHVACVLGHRSVVQAILSLKLDGPNEEAVNSTVGKDALTALHLAVLSHQEEVAKCLLLHSDSFTAVNAVDMVGRTALHIACEEELEAISIAIIHHPRFSEHRLRCCRGKSAMRMAKEKELRSVMDALAQYR